MKKVLFALMAVSMLATASSCKKCGYCTLPGGDTEPSVCKSNTASALGVDDYKETQTDCERRGGVWTTK